MQDLKAIRFIQGTKVSHDYEGDKVQTFSYRELIERNSPAIGIPCRQNGLLVVDIDVEGVNHKKDGREFWKRFSEENGIPATYTVKTQSGGYHFYFKLPASVNPDTFSPPSELAPGADIKWNGWVGAPPTVGYDVIQGNLQTIQVVPPSLMAYMANLNAGKGVKTFDMKAPNASLELHRSFTAGQLADLKVKMEWMQTNGSLSRAEWRDGLFALKAGVDDPVVLDELVCKWTMNRAYVQGDEDQARAIVARADKYGPIGPGSIFAIIKQVQLREGAPAVETPFTTQEILDRSGVQMGFNKDGSIKIEVSESNASAILGAIFDEHTLYHDIRTDLYIYKGRSYSDQDLINMFMPILQSPRHGLGLEKFRKQTVLAGLDILMASRRKDPHLDYLKGLKWDGTNRVEKFFSEYVGAEDTEYTRLVGKNFWTSLAARGLVPGRKFDSMVVLEGHEGIHKSSLVDAIGGQYTYAPARKDCFEHLDSLRSMHQSVIVELPELIGIIGMDSETVKSFLSKSYDHIRALFAKKAMRNERGFVFIGTVNPDKAGNTKYLSLSMGARRFWPIKIPKTVKAIRLNAIKADRDQLFAEAIALFRDNYEYWDMPKRLLDPLITTRVTDEPLAAPIREMVGSLGDSWTTTDVYRRLESTGFVARGLTSAIVVRIENTLAMMGCEQDGIYWKPKVSTMFLETLRPGSITLDCLI